MNKNKNSYIFIYSIILVVVVASVLSLVSLFLQPRQQANLLIEQKRNILASLNIQVEADNVESTYASIIKSEYCVDKQGNKHELANTKDQNKFPVYVAEINGKEFFVLSLSGTGLWGPIWGYIAFNNDFNTVYGIYFDNKSETPGLGAEISTPKFQEQYKGKKIFDENGTFVSIKTRKSGASGDNEVDAISGGTITSNSVNEMLEKDLGNYMTFIEKTKK